MHANPRISDYFYCGEGYALDAIKGFALAATVPTWENELTPLSTRRNRAES